MLLRAHGYGMRMWLSFDMSLRRKSSRRLANSTPTISMVGLRSVRLISRSGRMRRFNCSPSRRMEHEPGNLPASNRSCGEIANTHWKILREPLNAARTVQSCALW